MPLALALIPAALAVGGTGLAIAGQQKSQQALANARTQQTAKQKALQQQSNAVFRKSLAASTPQQAAAEMGRGEQQRMTAWNNLKSATTPIASALPAVSTTTSNPAGNALAQGGAATNAWNTLNAKAAAREGSYGDWENQQNIEHADTEQKLATLNNFSAGNANLLPLELGVAEQSGSQLSGWGNIVSSLGTLAGAAGKSGVFGGAKPIGGAGASASVGNTPSVWSSLASGDQPAWGAGGTAPNWSNIYRG